MRHFRRRHAIGRIHRSRRSKLTATNLIAAAIAFTPVASKSIENYNATSGGFMTKLSRGALATVSTSYTGYNPNDGKFYANDLVTGWVPLAGALVFKKIAGRFISRLI